MPKFCKYKTLMIICNYSAYCLRYVHTVKSFDDIVKTKVKLLVLFKQIKKTWHNVNKHKVDLLLNKLRTIYPAFKK